MYGLKDEVMYEFHLIEKDNLTSQLDDDAKVIVCKILYERKHFERFVKLYKTLSKKLLDSDFYINELAGECYLSLNNIVSARHCYAMALDVQKNLIAAYHKRIVLDYKIDAICDENAFLQDFKNAKIRKNISWVRDLAYIYYSYGNVAKSVECFCFIKGNGGEFNVIDILTLSDISRCYDLSSVDLNTDILDNSSFFKHEFECQASEHLFITLSASSNYVLKGYSIYADRLSLVDLSDSYFTLSNKKISNFIYSLYESHNYKKISIVGLSKGGSGALMLYDHLKERLDIPVSCVAFSPQMKLFPFNDNLVIPSYRRFANAFMCNKLIADILNGIKQPFQVSKSRPHDKVTVVYGNGFLMDKKEVSLISASADIDLLELEYSGHGSSIPLTIPEGKTLDELRVKYKKLTVDEDFKALGGGDLVDIVEQVYKIYSNPDMRLHKLL
jgi:tetratricopeptide (TPR) repeat protein